MRGATMQKMMDKTEALRAIRGNQPIVIESRKYGIVADWYAARNKNEFSLWLRRQVLADVYPEIEYGRTWRAWAIEPTDKERKVEWE